MKNKKGFTLVELLAVIAILAILVIIALPNVIGMFNDAKKSSFTTECKRLYKIAEQSFMNDSLYDQKEQVYSRCDGCTNKELDLSGRDTLKYYIKFNKAGKVVEFYATDGDYQYVHNNSELLITEILYVDSVADLEDNEILTIKDDKVSLGDDVLNKEKANKFDVVYRANDGTVSLGDEFSINDEHFIVFDTNSLQTELISKYNLNIGSKTVSSSPIGLQSQAAKGWVSPSNQYGCVRFSGTNYWKDQVGDGLKYSGSYGSFLAYVYDNQYIDSSGNNYSVAYYVEEYVQYLKSNVSFDIYGRIPKIQEKFNNRNFTTYDGIKPFIDTNYWTGSPYSSGAIMASTEVGNYFDNLSTPTLYNDVETAGVKPVITVNTNTLK